MSPVPLISVVIPTYNRANLLLRAVQSVSHQTVHPLEILVVDDGSTDDTATLIGSRGDTVRLLLQDHGGPSRARNKGVREAKGEWIAFLDSDDVWHDTYLERMSCAIIQTSSAADLYFSDVEWARPSGSVRHWSEVGFSVTDPVTMFGDGSPIVLLGFVPMLLPFTIVSRKAYLECGGLSEHLWAGEDTHLFLKMGLGKPICAVSGVGGVVTDDELVSENRLTRSHGGDTRNRWENAVEMYLDIVGRFPNLPVSGRTILLDRLAHAYWRLAVIAFRARKPLRCLLATLRSLRASPSALRSLLWQTVRHRLGYTTT